MRNFIRKRGVPSSENLLCRKNKLFVAAHTRARLVADSTDILNSDTTDGGTAGNADKDGWCRCKQLNKTDTSVTKKIMHKQVKSENTFDQVYEIMNFNIL